jgi:orotate phosphoribosyltransferase
MGKIVDTLKKIGAVITDDHFVYTSGKHGEVYINKDALYPYTKETSEVCLEMAQKFAKKEVEAVVGPALGGIILSQWVAYHLSKLKSKEIFGIYTEKDEHDDQVLRRGYDQIIKGKKVLVVEDLTTTGGSVKKVVNTIRAAGAEVVAVCVMVNRDPKNVNAQTVGAPFVAADVLEAKAYNEADCPFCKANRPINTKIGHGQKYLESKK